MRISVCMATHNGETYLRKQIDSILSQLNNDDELIISDDGSTDKTISIITGYDDHRIRLIHSNFQNNTIKNFENALIKSTGNYIFLSDQDDVWSHDKIKIMTNTLRDNDLVLCDCTLVNNELDIISPSLYSLNKTKKGIVRNFMKNGYIGCCMAFNRKVLEKALPFPKNIPMHDQWIGLVAEKYFRTKHIADKLVQYRRHVASSSTTGNRSKNSLVSKLKYRYILFSRLIKLGI